MVQCCLGRPAWQAFLKVRQEPTQLFDLLKTWTPQAYWPSMIHCSTSAAFTKLLQNLLWSSEPWPPCMSGTHEIVGLKSSSVLFILALHPMHSCVAWSCESTQGSSVLIIQELLRLSSPCQSQENVVMWEEPHMSHWISKLMTGRAQAETSRRISCARMLDE